VEGSSPYIGVYGTGLFGVKGVSSNTGVWGTGNAGVIGTSSSTVNGGGVVGQATAITGNAPGVFGWTNSPSGYGVQGAVQASSGGTAGYFQVNTGSATILQGNNGSTTEFTVDAVGDVTAAGAVSGSTFQIAGQLFAFGSSVNGNAFLGFAGNTEMTGAANTASGAAALAANGAGGGNTASGFEALEYDCIASAGACSNNLGSYNTAAGYQALIYNTTGFANTGTGSGAGRISDGSYLTGNYNTALGFNAGFSKGNLTNATAIGANAVVSESNALVLGSGANVGIGSSAPGHLLDVAGFVAFDSTGQNNGNGIDLTFGVDAGEGISSSRTAGPNQYGLDLYTDYNRRISIEQHGNVGIGTTSPDNLLTVNGSADKPGGGSWGTFSDGRLKTVNGGFTPGLSQVMKINPIHYRYKPDNAMGIRDTDEHIGVVAQDVQKVIPEAVTENSKGYMLVNNDPIIWTMLNAIKEQQREIKQQQNLLRAQSAAMRSLKAEVRETRESLRRVKAQVATTQPTLVAAK
jgi:Chaperone of endosialidase